MQLSCIKWLIDQFYNRIGNTGWSGVGLLATNWSASIMKLKITLLLDDGIIFDASFYTDIIRQSHLKILSISLAFLDIITTFTLFHKLAINLLILWHYSTIFDFDL